MKRSITTAVILAFALNLAACGTILYPERKGQVGGRLDPAVVILDGVGLFFFLVPGIVAYVVDLSNGTIYLPDTQANIQSEAPGMTVIETEEDITAEYLEELIAAKYGKEVSLNAETTQVREINTLEEAHPDLFSKQSGSSG